MVRLSPLLRWSLVAAFLVAVTACNLPPWPIGEPRPVRPDDDDDVAADDDDDATADDDDTTVGDDDDATADDDDLVVVDDDDDNTPDPNDVDGDGYAFTEDCDDTNPLVNPGQDEISCNGLDDDCDGTSPCHPCAEGSPVDVGAISSGTHEYIGSLTKVDAIYGQDGNYHFDLYRFVAGASGLYYFDLVSSEFDTYLELYDAGCNLQTSDDSSGEGSNARISDRIIGEGAVFHIVTSSSEDLETGGYELQVFVLGV